MDEKLYGIFLGGVEVRRLDDEAFDFVAVRAGEPEGTEVFKRRFARIVRHVNLRKDLVVDVGYLGPRWMRLLLYRVNLTGIYLCRSMY